MHTINLTVPAFEGTPEMSASALPETAAAVAIAFLCAIWVVVTVKQALWMYRSRGEAYAK